MGASFYYLTFVENGGFFKDDVIFEKKFTFFQTGRSLNSIFFKSEKSNSVVQKLKIYQKNLPKKIFQDGGYFHNGVCTFFLYVL
jgi:hypothetical protein